MKKIALASVITIQACFAAGAMAQEQPVPAKLAVSVEGIEDGKPIAEKFSYCTADGSGKTKNGGNTNPAISWSGAPAGTKSYTVIVVDPDVPASFDSANKEGKTIAADFPRQNFYHWVLVDIPANITGIPEGKNSYSVIPQGKAPGKTQYGINGMNSYPHGGYDGPCPPWNDERLHHYHFKVYALDVESLGLQPTVQGKEAEAAMASHILAEGEVVGTYTTNPKLLPK